MCTIVYYVYSVSKMRTSKASAQASLAIVCTVANVVDVLPTLIIQALSLATFLFILTLNYAEG